MKIPLKLKGSVVGHLRFEFTNRATLIGETMEIDAPTELASRIRGMLRSAKNRSEMILCYGLYNDDVSHDFDGVIQVLSLLSREDESFSYLFDRKMTLRLPEGSVP